jgi:peptidyl-prolyl cis-trans isomerase A (cyclophilin A)
MAARAATLGAMRIASVFVVLVVLGCSGGSEPAFRPRREGERVEREEPETPPPGRFAPPSTPTPPPLAAAALPEGVDPRLLDPANFTDRAPDTFSVELATTEGPIVIDVTRAWAPNGADRFYNMVRSGLLTDVAFFRAVDDFMVQTGIPGTPALARAWNSSSIPDDPRTQSNLPGYVSFAATGRPNSRSIQFFINTTDNSRLDGMGFAPFGRVRDMTTVGRLYTGYGDAPPAGRGPSQARIVGEGNTYLRAEFPELDYIERARILP